MSPEHLQAVAVLVGKIRILNSRVLLIIAAGILIPPGSGLELAKNPFADGAMTGQALGLPLPVLTACRSHRIVRLAICLGAYPPFHCGMVCVWMEPCVLLGVGMEQV